MSLVSKLLSSSKKKSESFCKTIGLINSKFWTASISPSLMCTHQGYKVILPQLSHVSPSSSLTASGEESEGDVVNSSFHFFLFLGGGSALAFDCLGLGLDRAFCCVVFCVGESDTATAVNRWARRALAWEPLGTTDITDKLICHLWNLTCTLSIVANGTVLTETKTLWISC